MKKQVMPLLFVLSIVCAVDASASAIGDLMDLAPEGAAVAVPEVQSGPAADAQTPGTRVASTRRTGNRLESAPNFATAEDARVGLDARVRSMRSSGRVVRDSGVDQAAGGGWYYWVLWGIDPHPEARNDGGARFVLASETGDANGIQYFQSQYYSSWDDADGARRANVSRLNTGGFLVLESETLDYGSSVYLYRIQFIRR